MDIRSCAVENTWLDRRVTEVGWGNGYVLIPPEHPLFGLGYDHPAIYALSVHGGITYAECLTVSHFLITKGYVSENYLGYWVLGFDTAHYGDYLGNWTKEAVEKETAKLEAQLKSYQVSLSNEDNSVKKPLSKFFHINNAGYRLSEIVAYEVVETYLNIYLRGIDLPYSNDCGDSEEAITALLRLKDQLENS